ncbi:hypothetical protein D9M68_928250 [compost metagenome]
MVVDRGFGPLRSEQVPDVLVLRNAQIQAGQRGQVCRYSRDAVLGQQRRTGHQALATIGQDPHHQVAVL